MWSGEVAGRGRASWGHHANTDRAGGRGPFSQECGQASTGHGGTGETRPCQASQVRVKSLVFVPRAVGATEA